MLPIIYMSACSFSCKNIDQDNQVSKSISMMLMSVCANVYIFYLFCSFLSIINTSERHIFFFTILFSLLFFLLRFLLIDSIPFDWYFPKLCPKNWNGENVLQKRVKKRSQFWNEKKSMMFYYFLPNIDRNGNRSNKHKNCK